MVLASTSNVASVASTTHGSGFPHVPQWGDPRGAGRIVLRAPQFGQTRIDTGPLGGAAERRASFGSFVIASPYAGRDIDPEPHVATCGCIFHQWRIQVEVQLLRAQVPGQRPDGVDRRRGA